MALPLHLKAPKKPNSTLKTGWETLPPRLTIRTTGIFKKVSIVTLIVTVFFHMVHYCLAAAGALTELSAKHADSAIDKFDYVALAIMFTCLGGKLTGKAADMIKMFKKTTPSQTPPS